MGQRLQASSKNHRADARVPAILPGGVQRDYFSDLLFMVVKMEEIVRLRLLPALDTIANEQRGRLGLRVDAPSDDIDRVLMDIRAEFDVQVTPGMQQIAADKAAESASNVNRKQVQAQTKAIGLDVFQDAPGLGDMMRDFSKTNVKLIKSLPDTAFQRIEDIAQRGLAAGTRSATMVKEITKEFGITRKRAKLIARDQVSKLNAQLTRQRHKANGIKFSIWRTVGDERVRPEHEAREGQKFSNETGIEGEFPGEPINCRCFAEPVLGEAA